MTSLPISVNSNSKPAAAQSNSGNAEQQGTQEFGNVLAQQMAGSERAEPATGKQEKSAKNTAQQSNEDARDVAAENMTLADNPALVSAELLASLLGQSTASAQDNIHPAQNMAEEQPLMGQASVAEKQMQDMLPGAISDTQTIGLRAGKSAADKGTKTGILPGMQVVNQPGLFQQTMQSMPPDAQTTRKPPSIQEIMQGVPPAAQTAGKAGTAMEMMMDKALAERNPAELMQLTQAATAPGELTASTLPAMQPANSNPLTASAQIATPLHHPSWPDEFGQKVSWIVTQQNQTAELHLNPPQLGPLDITLKMSGDQANASFSSPHAAVREAIEQAMPRLREILADSGITLGQATVSDQPARQNRDETAPARNKRLSDDGVVENNPSLPAVSLPPVRRHHGMVDTFV